MANRRKFMQQLAGITGALSLTSLANHAVAEDVYDSIASLNQMDLDSAVADDELWLRIRQAYTTSRNVINLNNGGVSPQPKVVQEAVEHYNRISNEAPSYYMWRILDKQKPSVRRNLAEVAGCSPEEIAINRNTTEGIINVIMGMDLKKGDEVVLTKMDYSRVKVAWKQQEQRLGLKLKWIDLPQPMEDEDEMVKLFTDQFTSKTRVVNITHVINWTGQILPVKKICAAAKARGITTIVDGAHSFAHLDFKISDLDCDFFATSLHKWLCAPFGSGMLYVRKEKISSIWPLLPSDNPLSDNIKKFEQLGTHSSAIELAIGHAIDFHQMIGIARKEKRLRHLKDYWANQVKDIEGVQLNTSLNPQFSGALAHVNVGSYNASDLDLALFNTFKIHTSPIKMEGLNGVRITPHVYTTKKELDLLVEGIKKFAKG